MSVRSPDFTGHGSGLRNRTWSTWTRQYRSPPRRHAPHGGSVAPWAWAGLAAVAAVLLRAPFQSAGSPGAALLGAVAVAVSVTLAALLGRDALPGSTAAVVTGSTTVAVFVSTPLFDAAPVGGRLLAVPLVIAGFVAAVRAARSDDRHAPWWWAGAGVTAVAAVAVERTAADVVVLTFVILTMLAAGGRREKARRGVLALVLGAGAAVCVLAPFAVRLEASPTGVGDAVAGLHLLAPPLAATAPDVAGRVSHLLWAYLLSGAGVLALVALLPERRGLEDSFYDARAAVGAKPDLGVCARAVLGFELLAIALAGTYAPYDLLATVPGLLLAVLAALQQRPGRSRGIAVVLAGSAIGAVLAAATAA